MQAPSNIQLEFNLLGAILCRNEILTTVPFLESRHFYSAPHARIFSAIKTIISEGSPATPFTLFPLFRDDENIQSAGGIKYFTGAVGSAILSQNFVGEASLIAELSRRRDLIESAHDFIENLSRPDAPSSEETSAEFVKNIVAGSRGDGVKIRTDTAIADSVLEKMKKKEVAFKTGFPTLDIAMGGGLYRKKSYALCARKKAGKTAFVASLSHNLAVSGVKHLFIAAEMSDEEIMERTLSRVTGIYPSSFRDEKAQSFPVQERIAKQISKMNGAALYANMPGITLDDLQKTLSYAVMRHGITGYILDYWQLVGGKSKNKNKAEHLDEVAQWLADFGRKHDLWAVIVAQINQEGNTRGGEGIRLACDQAYELHREDVSMPQAWLEMTETRYTKWQNIGSGAVPGFMLNERGPFYEEFTFDEKSEQLSL